MATLLPTIGLVLITIAGVLHIGFFVLETLAWRRIGARVFGARPEHLEAIRPWAANQGWYNLLLAIGAIGGASTAMLQASAEATLAGIAIAAFAALCMTGAAIVLVSTSRRMLRGALLQGVAPALGLVAIAIAAVR